MVFTVRDYQDLLRLLNAHPEWREELRRAILSDDFLALPQIVRELAAAQKRTEERLDALAQRVEELAAAQKRTEERLEALAQRVEELAAAQKRTEERLEALAQRVEELAAAQKRTEERLDRIEIEMRRTRSEVANLSSMLGVSLEDEAGNVLATVMRQKGYRVLQDASALRFNGEVDIVLPVEDAQGRRFWVLLESKARLSRPDVVRWTQRVHSTEWRQALQQAGCTPPYLVYMYAIRVDISAREAVEENGIGLLKADGEIVAPAGTLE
jgi:predicted RNase H-like nuclease (RuvC/YqgF family)